MNVKHVLFFWMVSQLVWPQSSALLDRSIAWLQMAAWEQAAQGFEQYLLQHPFSLERARALLGAGQARLMLGQLEAAQEHFARGRESAADQVQRRNLLIWSAYLSELQKNYPAAEMFWKQALDLATSPEEQFELRLRLMQNFDLQQRWQDILEQAKNFSLPENHPQRQFLLLLQLRAAFNVKNWELARSLVSQISSSANEELRSSLEWYQAELAFRSQERLDTNRLWDQLASPNRAVAQAAATRLLAAFQQNSAQLERLGNWVLSQDQVDPALALQVWVQLATLADETQNPKAAEFWQRAWELRTKTRVDDQVRLRYALALAPTQPARALQVLDEAPATDLNSKLVRWEVLGFSNQDAAAYALGNEILTQFATHAERPQWLVRQATLAARLGRHSEVLQLAQQAGELATRQEVWLRLLIHANQALGRTNEAHTMRERLVNRVPSNPTYQLDLIRSALVLKNWSQARQVLLNIKNLSVFRTPPYSHEVSFWEGLLSLSQKNLAEADRLFNQLPPEAELSTDLRPRVLFYRAWLELNLEVPRVASARRRLEQLLRDFPNHELTNQGRLWLGRALTLAGEVQQAIATYRAAARGGERPQALLALGDLYVSTNQPSLARESLNQVVAEFPSLRPQAERRLIDVDVPTNEKPNALLALNRRYPQDPVGQLALYEAASLYHDQEDWTRAANLFQQFIRQYSQHEKLESAAILGSQAFLKLNQPLESLLLLGLVENLNRNLQQREQLQIQKAQSLEALGRYPEALEVLRALPSSANSTTIQQSLRRLRLLSEGRDNREAELLSTIEATSSEPSRRETARLELLTLWLERGTWRDAEFEEQLSQALRLPQAPLRAQAELLNGRFLERRGQANAAVEAYLRAVRTSGVLPETAAEALYRAWTLMKTSSPEQAPTLRQTLLNRFPTSSWAERARREAP